MFEGFSAKTVDFMWNLRLNNRKEWFEEHKEEFRREFQTPMRTLSQDVFALMSEACGERGFIVKVSRIYKDARRLHGSDPYRDNLWFSIERPAVEWTSTPVFWFELGPTGWSYGMGYYQARPGTMARLRARIDANPKQFEKLIAPLERQGEFLLDGADYAREKIAPTSKTAAWYNKKSFSLIHKQSIGAEIFAPALAARIADGFLSLMPLYDYLITLDADPEPLVGVPSAHRRTLRSPHSP